MCVRYFVYLWPVLLTGLLAGCDLVVQPDTPGESVKTITATPPPPPKPTVIPKPVAPRQPAVSREPAPVPVKCGIKLTDSEHKLADAYYLKADRFFNVDEPKKAKDSLKTALCLEPTHKKAKDLLDALLQVYPD